MTERDTPRLLAGKEYALLPRQPVPPVYVHPLEMETLMSKTDALRTLNATCPVTHEPDTQPEHCPHGDVRLVLHGLCQTARAADRVEAMILAG